jgi:thymidylate synthase (FAD)
MKIVRPYATLLSNLEAPLTKIEWCARVSHRSEEAQTTSSYERFIRSVVLDHGDWSVVEHVTCSVDLLVDRGITHELVRHRLFSYTQESTRFVNYQKKMPPSFIYPKVGVECDQCLNCGDHPASTGIESVWAHHEDLCSKKTSSYAAVCDCTPTACPYDYRWLVSINEAELAYIRLMAEGWRPQEARSVFPNALASRIIMTGNLRNWRHFFIMRTTQEAHPQMRQVTIPLLEEFKRAVPILFEDLEPNARQVDNLRKPR